MTHSSTSDQARQSVPDAPLADFQELAFNVCRTAPGGAVKHFGPWLWTCSGTQESFLNSITLLTGRTPTRADLLDAFEACAGLGFEFTFWPGSSGLVPPREPAPSPSPACPEYILERHSGHNPEHDHEHDHGRDPGHNPRCDLAPVPVPGGFAARFEGTASMMTLRLPVSGSQHPSGPVDIRTGDATILPELFAAAALGFDDPGSDTSSLTDLFAELVDAHALVPVVAELDGKVVGTLLLHLSRQDPHRAGIYWLSTVPSHRGRQIASDLVRCAATQALTAGRSTLVLQSTPVARGLYRRLGFTPGPVTESFLLSPF